MAYTIPEVWQAVQMRHIENQGADKKDAKYIAFLLTQRRDKNKNAIPSAITHIAKVLNIKTVFIDRSYFEKEMPEIKKIALSKGWDKMGDNKEYKLGRIKKLDRPILHQKGRHARGQVCFYTTLEELKNTKYKYIQEIKTEGQLKEENKKNNYYIKYVWGPHAQDQERFHKDLIHFAKGQEKACQHFRECKGFLLYETGSKERDKKGAKAINAWGVIAPDQPSFIEETISRGKKFPCAVKVKLRKRVPPENGIPLRQIEEIIKTKIRRRPGGLLEITKEQFERLRNSL